jgi:hypothetical protein
MDVAGRPPTSCPSNLLLSGIIRIYTRLLRDGKEESGRAPISRGLSVVDDYVRYP